MRYYHQSKDYLSLKILAWIISTLIVGALVTIMTMSPDHRSDRARRVTRTGRRYDLIDDGEEYTIAIERIR